MVNTFTITNISSGRIQVCGENISAGASEDIKLTSLIDDPDCTEELAQFVNTGDISISVPSFSVKRLSLKEKQALDWISNSSGFGAALQTTTGAINIYVNGTSGDDNNTGLSESQPLKTLAAVERLLPLKIRHLTVLNLRGTFTDDVFSLIRFLQRKSLHIHGGNDVVVVDDNSGANYDITGVPSAKLIDTTGTPFTIDQYYGYWVQILDATNQPTGQIRDIQEMTTSGIIPGRDFNSIPTTANKFRIVRPATELAGTKLLLGVLDEIGLWDGVTVPSLRLTNLFMTGTAAIYTQPTDGRVDATGIIFANNSLGAFINILGQGHISIAGTHRDPTTDLAISHIDGPHMSLSILDTDVLVRFDGPGQRSLLGVQSIAPVEMNDVRPNINRGTRFKGGLSLYRPQGNYSNAFAEIQTDGNYGVTRIENSSGDGLLVHGGDVRIEAGVDISDCAGHGIRNRGGKVRLEGNVTGSSNTGHGVKNGECGTVSMLNGSPPSLTGTGGDLQQGTTTTTWAALDVAGQIIESTADLAVANEYA